MQWASSTRLSSERSLKLQSPGKIAARWSERQPPSPSTTGWTTSASRQSLTSSRMSSSGYKEISSRGSGSKPLLLSWSSTLIKWCPSHRLLRRRNSKRPLTSRTTRSSPYSFRIASWVFVRWWNLSSSKGARMHSQVSAILWTLHLSSPFYRSASSSLRGRLRNQQTRWYERTLNQFLVIW